MARQKKRTTKARRNQSALRGLLRERAGRDQSVRPAPFLRGSENPPSDPTQQVPTASQYSDLQLAMMRLLYGSDEDRIQAAIRIQPKLIMNRREYDLAKDLALSGNTGQLRKIFRKFVRDLAKYGVRYWFDYFGVKPGKGGAPKKELFTDSTAYPVGDEVEKTIERFRPFFTSKSHRNPIVLREKLVRHGIPSTDIEFILDSRNPKAAACKSVSIRSELSVKTVRNYYLQYERKRPKN